LVFAAVGDVPWILRAKHSASFDVVACAVSSAFNYKNSAGDGGLYRVKEKTPGGFLLPALVSLGGRAVCGVT
jgi:hypothetical protein